MNDSWEDMRKAKEDLYFQKRNIDALKKIRAERGNQVRKSPITGEPMEEVVFKEVVIDRCKTTGGIWLDPGELEKIIQNIENEKKETGQHMLKDLFSFLSKEK